MDMLFAAVLLASAQVDCNSANVTTTIDIAECAKQSAALAESKMTGAYEDAVKKLSGPEHATELRLFQQAQSAWLSYRTSLCKAIYERYRSGTMRGIVFSGCMQEHAERRTWELQEYPGNE